MPPHRLGGLSPRNDRFPHRKTKYVMCITLGSRTHNGGAQAWQSDKWKMICSSWPVSASSRRGLRKLRTLPPNFGAWRRIINAELRRRMAAVNAKERNAGVGDQLWLRSSSHQRPDPNHSLCRYS